MCHFLEEEEVKGWYKRGNFPHYDNDSVCQFITFRLHDSVTKEVIEYWKEKISDNPDLKKDEYKILYQNICKYEDNGYGACYLKIPAIKKIVEDAFKYHDTKRYDLIEFIVMPNHVHVLIKPFEGESLSRIVRVWKSYTALKANRYLNRKGKFWMNDYFDRYIRNEQHFERVIEYIRNNGKKK